MINEEHPAVTLEVPYSQPVLKLKKPRKSRRKKESVCGICEREFPCKSLLRRHMKTAHIKPEVSAAC